MYTFIKDLTKPIPIKPVLGICILILIPVIFWLKAQRQPIEIISYLARDRIIPLDRIVIKSTMIVGFKLSPSIKYPKSVYVRGELYLNNRLISQDKISHLDYTGGNVALDIQEIQGPIDPKSVIHIPDGQYKIVLSVFDRNGTLLGDCEKRLKRHNISRRFDGLGKKHLWPEYREIQKPENYKNGFKSQREMMGDADKDYFVLKKSSLERVYSCSRPENFEKCSELSMSIARNETRPLTFSVYAKRDLGKLSIKASVLNGKKGFILSKNIDIGSIGYLTETVRNDDDRIVFYRYAPKIIQEKDVIFRRGEIQRYWITIRVPKDALPGIYKGLIIIKPELGQERELPLCLKVLPLCLEDTDIQYGMMMTYEFYELDNFDWTDSQRKSIARQGFEICRDLRDHGMTMLYPHSHFYLNRNEFGEPILESLRASLEAYKELAFPGPFCWYLGHFLQTAKAFHPGSILNYDEDVAKARLRLLLSLYEKIAGQIGIPKNKLIVQTVDEADQEARVEAGKLLNGIAGDMGFKTLVTRRWPDVDVVCTFVPANDKEAAEIREIGKFWWIYPNEALTTKHRVYTRYVFGFGAWKWGVDGVVPWTYQMSQGCNGNPFSVLDGDEVMVAYPGLAGPLSTPLWETIRDGINDYKYIYQLKKLIAQGIDKGDPRAGEIKNALEDFKKNLGKEPGPSEGDMGDWPPSAFDQLRQQIAEWALELYQSGNSNAGGSGRPLRSMSSD